MYVQFQNYFIFSNLKSVSQPGALQAKTSPGKNKLKTKNLELKKRLYKKKTKNKKEMKLLFILAGGLAVRAVGVDAGGRSRARWFKKNANLNFEGNRQKAKNGTRSRDGSENDNVKIIFLLN